jgi:hypothetical protein
MAEPLLIDNVSCICIDDLSNAQIVEKIKYNSDSGRYTEMSRAAYTIFKDNVDYDKEQKAIEAFIAKLI